MLVKSTAGVASGLNERTWKRLAAMACVVSWMIGIDIVVVKGEVK
jgi:hypothetical protein